MNKLKIAGIIGVILAVFGLGIYVGFDSGSHQAIGATERANIDAFWKTWDVINEKFVPASSTKKISDEAKVYGAISGLVDSLGDPYTTFFPPEELKSFEEDIHGNFEGVGMEVETKEGDLTVVSPLKGSPAEKAGMKAGDKVIKIDDTYAKGLTTNVAVKLIRGKAGTSVKLTIDREGKEEVITIVRGIVKIPSTSTETKDGVFIIHLYNFSAQASTEFKSALKEFINTKSNRLIIDLRNNPGGYLEASVDIASWFLPVGKTIVSEDFGKNKEPKIIKSKGYNIFNNKLKVVVLINEGSASASEILAGALSENGVAKLVGVKSFGKGSVQELIPITKDASVKVTIARWLTPKGNSISEKGVEPDIEVKMTEEDTKAKRDPQLEKAIEIVKSMK